MPDLIFSEHETEDGEKVFSATTDQSATHTICEGIIGECLANMKSSLDVLWEYVQDGNAMKAEKFSEPTFHAIREEVETALDMLESIKRSEMRPKHRDCRTVMKKGARLLARNSPTSDVFEPERFLRDSLALMSAMHLCLLEQTKKKARSKIRKEYVDAASATLHA